MGWNDRIDRFGYTPNDYERYVADVIDRADEERKSVREGN